MSLYASLQRRGADDPVRVAMVGLGTFGQMFTAQVRRTPGMHLAGISDLNVEAASRRLLDAGWEQERIGAASLDRALKDGTTWVTDDTAALLADERIDVLIEATGNPVIGTMHALKAFEAGTHVVMVNVEADALVGHLLAQRAAAAGCVYTLASGDQPALICELVDWARTAGFDVLAAGKGTKYLTEYRDSTPDTVWDYYGIDAEHAAQARFNSQMFNSFLDGTKSAIEMTAVANATGLAAPANGLKFPPSDISELPTFWAKQAEGRLRGEPGIVEVVSSERRDGTPIIDNLRWGVFVAFAADNDYVAARLADYGSLTDESGKVAVLYRPTHFIGLELGTSVASAAIRGEAMGAPRGFTADAVAVAKRDLKPGDRLDGEGGFTVRGEVRPATAVVEGNLLPIGLAGNVNVTRAVEAGTPVAWSDVDIDETTGVPALRRSMERDLLATMQGAAAR